MSIDARLVLEGVGAVMLAVGAGLVYLPAGLIVGGLLLIMAGNFGGEEPDAPSSV